MSNTFATGARVLLKARPTPEQLRDRIAEPVPDGLELYLDAADIGGDDWATTLEGRIAELNLPPDFVWVVEGPLRSLDGTFFDVARDTPANREVLRRVVGFGRTIGATMAVIHAIALAGDGDVFTEETSAATLEASLPLVRYYAELCRAAGLVPTIENVPPVMKMRESRVLHSLIGMEPRDLWFLTDAVPGLKVTLDTSHAQLYLNVARLDVAAAPPEVAAMTPFLVGRREVATLDEYIDRVADLVVHAHFSNARGVFGEGLAYGDGELDLDRATVRLAKIARCLVTETIEPDPNRSVRMRGAQRRMIAALANGRKLAGRPGA